MIRTVLSGMFAALRRPRNRAAAIGDASARPIWQRLGILWLVVLTWNGSPALCQPAEHDTVRHITRTGVRVVVREEVGSGLVAIVAAVDTSGAEALLGPWMKRVTARALFGGNRNLSAEGVAREIHRTGGSLSVELHPDCLIIRCVTTPAAFHDAAYVILQALKGAVFDAETLRRASASVAAEADEEAASPLMVGAAAARSRLFSDHRYGARLAPPDARARASLASTVNRFYTAAFVPANTVVAIVGDVDRERAIRAMENYAVDYDRRVDQRVERLGSARPTPPDAEEPRRIAAAGRTATRSGAAVVGMPLPGRRDPDAAAAAVLAAVVGGGKGSRMFREIRDARGVGYIVGAEAHLWRDAGWLEAFVEHDARRAVSDDMSVGQMIEATLEALLRSPPDEMELERAQAYVAGVFRRGVERSADVARALAEAELLDGDWRTAEDFVARVQAVTVEDVMKVARRMMERRVVVTINGAASP